jgi:SAM-dependent MidA family methyltransferase
VLPAHLSHLPAPAPEATVHSTRLAAAIRQTIAAAGGWISFARFMDLALHAPGLGYYSAGAQKFGGAGDFVTAPELGSLFGSTLARQAAQILHADNGAVGDIIEYGAGSGRLACDLLRRLLALDCLPQRYCILETSADLRARQRALIERELPMLAARVHWLDAMPSGIDALVIANEVLDAMPVHLVTTHSDRIDEIGVTAGAGAAFVFEPRPAGGALLSATQALELAPGMTTEIGLAARAFAGTLADALRRGAAILIDYGFPRREFYHSQRASGTLMCHYRHHSHADPLCLVGLQDITAHVDFSAIADAVITRGAKVAGFAGQAQFLINCGITDVLAATPAGDTANYLPQAAQAQKLLSPAEMGELFKVFLFSRDLDIPFIGFAAGNRLHTL